MMVGNLTASLYRALPFLFCFVRFPLRTELDGNPRFFLHSLNMSDFFLAPLWTL